MGPGGGVSGADVRQYDLLLLAGEDYSGRRRDAAEAPFPDDQEKDAVITERICSVKGDPRGYRQLYCRTGTWDKKRSDRSFAACAAGV